MQPVHQHDSTPELVSQHDCGRAGPLISTQLVALFIAQAGLVVTLIMLCGMAPAAAAGLAVVLVAGDIYATTSSPRGLKALLGRTGWGQ